MDALVPKIPLEYGTRILAPMAWALSSHSCPCLHHDDSKASARSFGLYIIHHFLELLPSFSRLMWPSLNLFCGLKPFFFFLVCLFRNLHNVLPNGALTCSQGWRVPVLPWAMPCSPSSGNWFTAFLFHLSLSLKYFQPWSYHSWGSEYTSLNIFHVCVCMFVYCWRGIGTYFTIDMK